MAVTLFVTGWALAQPGPARPGPEVPGRFAVTPLADGAVLLDTATGKTWVLRAPVDGLPRAWEPAVRLDTREEVDKRENVEDRLKQARERAKVQKQ